VEVRLIDPGKRFTELVLTTSRNDRKFAERLGAIVILTASRSRRLEFLLKVVEGPVSSPSSLKVLCQQPRGPGLVVHRAASPARDRIIPLGCVPPSR
jgi:hypothetical protein